MTKLDQAKINDIIRTFIQETLDFDEDVRTNRKAPFSLEEIDQRADFIGSLKAEKQEDLARCDYRSAAPAVNTVIQNHGLKVAKGSEDYSRLSREVLKAEIAMLEVEHKRTLGDYSSPQEAALRASIDPNHWSDGKQGHRSVSEQQQEQTSATIKQAGEDFWNEFNHGWKPRSRTDYKNVIEQIVEGFGPETQLHKRDGVWCIDIREDNAKRKSVKVGERRIVPLHPFIVDDLRFIEFVKSVPAAKKRVFHELVYVNNRWGHGFGQWFGRFKGRAGIDAEAGKKSFHSFRHTLINQLKQNEADPQYVKEFVGHKSGKDITWDLYGKSFKPATLMEKVVLKLDFPVDLGHLKASKWVPKSSAGGES